MRILTVRLGWIYSDGENGVAEKAKRRTIMSKVGIMFPEDADLQSPVVSLNEKQFIDMIALGEKGDVQAISHLGETIDGAIDKIASLARKFEAFAEHVGNAQYNEKVEVYTPGMGLMLFNRVMLLNDACSDALQTELDNGWRIIAACPQPDQRRPDYIMGRYDKDDESGAARSAYRPSHTPETIARPFAAPIVSTLEAPPVA
jgi:hypothetical protein